MDNTILINAIIRFVESYIKENINYSTFPAEFSK